jgi:hypothetical protein
MSTIARWSAVIEALVVLTAAAAAASAGTDRFGVTQLYPTASGGKEWVSKWDNGVARNFAGVDPQDAWFDAAHGSAQYSVDGKGLFKITGSTPRMYIHDPAKVSEWHDVEATVYAMRVADDGTPYAGIVNVTRSNHGTTGPELSNLCDTRGYGARVRYDGTVDFDKETSHPNATAVNSKPLFSGGMPKNKWIGYKHVTYDLPNGHVMNEVYVDLTDGLNGGTWTKVNSLEDTGSNMGVGAVACKSGINPATILTNSDARPGSESGKPNITVYWRSTNVGTNGLVYKKMSVREISAAGGATGTPTTAGTTTTGTTASTTTTAATTTTGSTATTTTGTTGGTTTSTTGTAAGAPAITNVKAANITQTGVTITWTTDKVSHSQVEYGVTPSYGTLSYQSTATGTSHNLALTNLKAGTLYHFRARSLDDKTKLAGVSADMTFMTAGTPAATTTSGAGTTTTTASAVISNVKAGNITSSGATITWNTTTNSHSQVEYGLTSSYGSTTYQSTATGTSHNMPLTGLKSKTTYHYRVRSLNSATGRTDVSGDYTLKTL